MDKQGQWIDNVLRKKYVAEKAWTDAQPQQQSEQYTSTENEI